MAKPKQRVVIVEFNQDKITESVGILNKSSYRVSHAVLTEAHVVAPGNPEMGLPETRGPQFVLLIADYVPPKPFKPIPG